MDVSAFDLAQRFIGLKELPGDKDQPFILGMLRLDQAWPGHDEVAWCSAFVNFVAWLLRLPRTKALGARSWLTVGTPITLSEAKPGYDVVVFRRGDGTQPGPDVIDAPGHVGFFAGIDGNRVLVLGGNQGDSVSITTMPAVALLGVRRLA